MAPKKNGKAKQPRIDSVYPKSAKKKGKKQIVVSSESDSDSSVEELAKRGPVRPRKVAVVEAKALFDEKEYEKTAWSLCVEKRGMHLPMLWFTAVCATGSTQRLELSCMMRRRRLDPRRATCTCSPCSRPTSCPMRMA